MPTTQRLKKPSSESSALIDGAASRVSPTDPALATWHDNYVAHNGDRLAVDIDILQSRVPPGQEILEIGSAPFVLTVALSEAGYAVTGCDLEPARYEASIQQLGLTVTQCNIETEVLEFDDDSFDVILLNEVFEHLRIDLIFTLRQLRRVLRPGGLLFVSTPNLKSIGGIKNFLFKGRAYSCSGDVYDEFHKLSELGHMGHVREYAPNEVVTFLEKIGFEVEEILYRGGYDRLPWRMLTSCLPGLLPFASFVARKVEAQD